MRNSEFDRLLLESDVIKAVDRHMKDYYQTDDDISCVLDNEISRILEEVNSVVIMGNKDSIDALENNVKYQDDGRLIKEDLGMCSDWIKCEPSHMPEDDERYKGKKVINVLVTTGRGYVTKVQRIHYIDFFTKEGYWYWGRINCEMRAWMPLPEPYKE